MLTKLRIISYSRPPSDKLSQFDFKKDLTTLAQTQLSEFVAYFNPESLQVQVGRNVKTGNTQNGEASQQNLGNEPTRYSFKLVIDGTGVSGPKIASVKAEVDKFVAFAQLTGPLTGENATPFLDLIWGDFYVQCQLESVSVQYTLFDPQGRPLRASLDCSFAEYMTGGDAFATDSAEGQLAVQGWTSLASIAGSKVNGMTQAVGIARKNGFDSIRGAKAGSGLLF